MQWIAPSEKDAATDALGKRLWAAAGQLRANSGLNTAHYSQPVLGLIFLPFEEVRFSAIAAQSFSLIHKLYLQIQNLRRTRDPLLPRVSSGQIEISAANTKEVPP